MAMLLAHQGGWDEALFVAVPVALFAVLLVRAKRNAEAEHRAEHARTEQTGRSGAAPGDDRPDPDER
jgi:hypothetical protein